MLSEEDEQSYWRTVSDCLVEIYNLTNIDVNKEIIKLKTRLKGLTTKEYDFIFHEEPLNMAHGMMVSSGIESNNVPTDAQLDYYLKEIKQRYL